MFSRCESSCMQCIVARSAGPATEAACDKSAKELLRAYLQGVSWPSISLALTLVIAKEISKSVCPFTIRLSVYHAAEFQARLSVYPCPPISQNPCIGAVFWTEKPPSVAVLWQGR